jgi:hypothetical protein
MPHIARVLLIVLGILGASAYAQAYDRVASLAESPISPKDGKNVDVSLPNLIDELDRATHTRTKIVLRPFARSLADTAAGKADLHIPFIQVGDLPAPKGLAYVTEVAIGQRPFVIYSRKTDPLDANAVGKNWVVLIEAGHSSFFPFPVTESSCMKCGLDMILLKRADALIVANDIVDPLLENPKYKGIHRALYKTFPVRALVNANADSTATRRYLIDGITRLTQTGDMAKRWNQYSDWQP